MKGSFTRTKPTILVILLLMQSIQGHATVANTPITIYLRGVYSAKISILGLNESRLFKPVVTSGEILNGDSVTLMVPEKMVPGEFVIRFEYRELVSSTPYPSEKTIFVNQQPLVLHASPKYSNNPDSSWFQPGELENSAFLRFSKENSHKKEQLNLLQSFLMSYENDQSNFFKQGVKEYESGRDAYNKWLKDRTETDRGLFISNLYPFQYIPDVIFKGSEQERLQNMIEHYFDGFDFRDPNMIRTSFVNKWMDNYVNLYGKMTTTTTMRDSLFPLAGKTAIEKARKGDPLIYGWMVDYFFRGYESNGIDAGIRMLEPYLNDPKCMTSKRQEIERRLKGIETLKPGVIAPEIILPDGIEGTFKLSQYKPSSPYILLVFWAAGCSHCAELIRELYPWSTAPGMGAKLSVVAISLDDNETDIGAWKNKAAELPGWKHLQSPKGVNGKEAFDYYVLSTPVLILINTNDMTINSMPQSIKDIQLLLH